MGCSLRGLFTLATVFMLFENGCGFRLSGSSEASSRHLKREKRCSCNNLRDKECIYFCHKDIIWVNTPGKTTPYGLGSPATRHKRSTPRCDCADSKDRLCSRFCQLDSSRGNSVQQKAGSASAQYQNPPQHQTLRSSTKQHHRTESSHLVWILRQIALSNIRTVQRKDFSKRQNRIILTRRKLFRERRR